VRGQKTLSKTGGGTLYTALYFSHHWWAIVNIVYRSRYSTAYIACWFPSGSERSLVRLIYLWASPDTVL
jgi:hypothetical protein